MGVRSRITSTLQAALPTELQRRGNVRRDRGFEPACLERFKNETISLPTGRQGNRPFLSLPSGEAIFTSSSRPLVANDCIGILSLRAGHEYDAKMAPSKPTG